MRKKMNKRWMPPLLAATMLVTTAAPAKILADDPQEPILTETGESSLSAEPSLSAEEPSLIAAPDDQGVTDDQAAAASTDSNAAANANLIATNPTATIAVDPTSIERNLYRKDLQPEYPFRSQPHRLGCLGRPEWSE